jgi:hypothetical protein
MPLLAYEEALLLHAPPTDSSHPERPDRTAAIMARLVATGLVHRCKRVSPINETAVCVSEDGGDLLQSCLWHVPRFVAGSLQYRRRGVLQVDTTHSIGACSCS